MKTRRQIFTQFRLNSSFPPLLAFSGLCHASFWHSIFFSPQQMAQTSFGEQASEPRLFKGLEEVALLWESCLFVTDDVCIYLNDHRARSTFKPSRSPLQLWHVCSFFVQEIYSRATIFLSTYFVQPPRVCLFLGSWIGRTPLMVQYFQKNYNQTGNRIRKFTAWAFSAWFPVTLSPSISTVY